MIISNLSCSKEDQLLSPIFQDHMPGKFFGEIAFDSKGGMWLETSEIDTTVHLPAYSSSIPIRIYLSRFYNNSYEVYDNRFIGANEMIFDKYDRLWFISNNKLYLLSNNQYTELYKIATEMGYFEWINIDHENNIWAGGYNSPLLKITLDPQIKVNNLSNNSTTVNSSAGCIDKNNELWIIMPSQNIGRRDTLGRWTFFNPENSALSYQSFWCISSDKDNNIWAGTGFPDSGINLMKFDGTKWESITIKDENGNPIYGTVRQLYSDSKKIWIVTEFSKGGAFDSNYLITFDGNKWNRVYEVPSDDGISDIEFDITGHKAWIATMNKGLFAVDLE